jgi:hypothetical protein
MLDDLLAGCPGVGHIVPRSHKKILHSLHFSQIFCHLIIVAVVLFLYLFCHELRVSPDEKSPNVELIGQPKPSDQPLVFCSVVGGRKLNLNRILQHITFGWNEHDVSFCPFQGVRSVEIHYPMIGQITDAS